MNLLSVIIKNRIEITWKFRYASCDWGENQTEGAPHGEPWGLPRKCTRCM